MRYITGFVTILILLLIVSTNIKLSSVYAEDQGRFLVDYNPNTSNPTYIEYYNDFISSYEGLAGDLNSIIRTPYDVYFRLQECNQPNAFYSPDDKAVTICYELIDHTAELFMPYVNSKEELGQALGSVLVFTTFHELGHAVIDIYNLPLPAKEEDAADSFAAILLIKADLATNDYKVRNMIINAASWFSILAEHRSELQFWDTHSLDQERFFNLICLVYGSDPASFDYLIGRDYLPEQRAVSCEKEYNQRSAYWDTALSPHIVPEFGVLVMLTASIGFALVIVAMRWTVNREKHEP